MHKFTVEIEGKSPLLMHHDNIEWSDVIKEWIKDPQNKKMSNAGDDRTPAWTWIGYLYNDGDYVAMPYDNIAKCILQAGAMIPTGGRSGKTFKSQTQSGIHCQNLFWEFAVDGKRVDFESVIALQGENDFSEHTLFAQENGFTLYIKRAVIGKNKHVRVRPRFDKWNITGEVVVTDEQLTEPVLQRLFEYAGKYVGLGDWRPGGKTPGPFGMFEADVLEV